MSVTVSGPARDSIGAPWSLYFLAGSEAMGYGTLFTLVGDYRDEHGISESMLGWIIGIGFLVAFLAQTFLGPFGDKGRGKHMILVGAIANIIGLLMLAWGTTALVLLAGRVISGLGIGTVMPPLRRMVVLHSSADVGRNLGTLFSVDVFGFAAGPVVSAVLVGPFGIPGPFIVVAALNVVATMLVFSRIEDEEADGEIEPSRFAFDLLRIRPFSGAVILGSAAFVMIGCFDALWDVVHEDLHTAEWMANLGIALFAIPLVVLGPFAGRLAQQRGPFLISAAGLIAASIFMGIYGVLTVGALIFAFTMGHAITDGLSFAAAGVAVGLAVPKSRQAGAQGLLGGAQALGAGLMAPLTGWIYEHHGQQAAYWTGAITVLAMVTLGLVVAGPDGRSLRGDPEADAGPDASAQSLAAAESGER